MKGSTLDTLHPLTALDSASGDLDSWNALQASKYQGACSGIVMRPLCLQGRKRMFMATGWCTQIVPNTSQLIGHWLHGSAFGIAIYLLDHNGEWQRACLLSMLTASPFAMSLVEAAEAQARGTCL